jgi:hypothetical protein
LKSKCIDHFPLLNYKNLFSKDYYNLGETYSLLKHASSGGERCNLYRLISEIGPNTWQYNSNSTKVDLSKNIIISYKLSIKNAVIKTSESWRLDMLNLISSTESENIQPVLSKSDLLKVKMYSLLQHSLHITMYKLQAELYALSNLSSQENLSSLNNQSTATFRQWGTS